MRIHLILLTTFVAFLHSAAAVRAQQVTISVKNAPLETVFRAIERQTPYVFFYPSRVVKDKKTVSLHLQNVDFETVMEKVLEGQGLAYLISENSVIIREAVAVPANSKNLRQLVKGRVTDARGKPLPGATIKIAGTNLGTTTDNEGRFQLYTPESEAVLLISNIGYLPIQKHIKGETSLEIKMIEATAQLKEVTVQPINTGYESISPERFVGTASVIDSAILSRSVSRNLMNRLDGVTSGLIFDKAGGTLHIRGISTISGINDLNNQSPLNPLIILDDFPFYGDLGSINPNDIENVSVLKDAAATSIWGAKAGNGVLVITTKSGKYGRSLNINISSNVQVNEKPDIYYNPVMSSSDFIDVEQFLFDKGYMDDYFLYPSYYVLSPAAEILQRKRLGEITAAEASAQLNTLKGYDIRRDYDKYVLRNSVNKQNYLNISGGGSNYNYLMSFGADNDLTSVKGPGRNDRYSFNSNLNIKPARFLELHAGFAYVRENIRADGLTPEILSTYTRGGLYPYARLADEQGNHLAIAHRNSLSFLQQQDPRLLDWNYRPLDEMEFTNTRQKGNTVRLNAGATANFTKWLTGEVRYQYSSRSTAITDLSDERTFRTRDLINNFTDPTTFKRNFPLGGILDRSNAELVSHNVRGLLRVSRIWNDVHTFTALVAGELGKANLEENKFRTLGYDKDNLVFSGNPDFLTQYPVYYGGAMQIPNNAAWNMRTDKTISVLGNASYTYDRKYTIYASARRDGSNLLGANTNNKWKPLWSTGIKYDIGNEGFFKVPVISSLAIRASYGYAGNINNSLSALTLINYTSYLNAAQQQQAIVSSPPNPDLRWEQVGTLNGGLDFAVLHSRISGSVDIYKKKAKDVITAVPVDPTNGVGATVRRNQANLETNGVDITIKTINLNKGVRWTTTFNYSHVKTKVTRFFTGFVSTPNFPALREGEIFNAIYAYKWAGLDPENGDPRGYLGKTISKEYDQIFQDSASNQAFIGSSIPTDYGNMLHTVSYRNFDLSFNISFRAGYYYRKPSLRYDYLYDNWTGHEEYANRWKTPGDEARTNVPSQPYPVNFSREQFYEFSEVNYEKGDHIRLQDIQLTYNWTNNRYTRFPVKSASAFLLAGNLNLFIWKASAVRYDPDYAMSVIPPARSLALGIRVQL
ncbi:SusC/RagA family TonB-linked outer membrane protein [Chitinophaga pollutisoli]|uniref:SusC/RagA family TonB-linked outer membrane protein n=1 Tax=Chitinophaga pollutisoli TaxID=3133966 RepID=A0ABZ2YLJ5_9BACT